MTMRRFQMRSVYLPTADKDKRYYLVVVDENTGEESFRHSVIMDLVFGDEF